MLFRSLVLISSLFSLTTCTTWYARVDGGSRNSDYDPTGQCNGLSDSPYPGSGVNQSCAFNDIRYFWTKGDPHCSDPSCGWDWMGRNPGDTYIVGQKEGGWRLGWSNLTSAYDGFAQNGADRPCPTFPSNGTLENPIRFLGTNWQNCSNDSAKTALHAGFSANFIVDLEGVSGAYIACFDMSDLEDCGACALNYTCERDGIIRDYAKSGIVTNYLTTDTALVDINLHGFSSSGWAGPTGNNVRALRIKINGNSCSGWNTDNQGVNGRGNVLMDYFTMIGNGCAEMYPIDNSYKYPYTRCSDQLTGENDALNIPGVGYGDAFGTGDGYNDPAWIIQFDHGEVAYNTQDGLDSLHLDGIDSHGVASAVIITNTVAYGSMGDQIKTGAAGVIRNCLVYDSPNAMSVQIPGFPPGFNDDLTFFARAGGTGIIASVSVGQQMLIEHTTLVSSTQYAQGLVIGGHASTNCAGATSDPKTQCGITYRNNLFMGFECSAANGWTGENITSSNHPCDAGRVADRFYWEGVNVWNQSQSICTNNAVWHQWSESSCPDPILNEKNAVCNKDPLVVNENYNVIGVGDLSVKSASSPLVGAGVTSNVTTDINGYTRANPPTIGAYEYGTKPIATWDNSPLSPPLYANQSIASSSSSSSSPSKSSSSSSSSSKSSSSSSSSTTTTKGSTMSSAVGSHYEFMLIIALLIASLL